MDPMEGVEDTLPKYFKQRGPEPYPDSSVTRKQWGALPLPENVERIKVPVENVLLTHTETDGCNSKATCIEVIKALQLKHKEQGFSDIKHNFLVGGDGKVYEGRGWKMKPEVSRLYPEIAESCIDVGYIGYKGFRPEKVQRYAGKSLVKDSVNNEQVSETATYYSDL